MTRPLALVVLALALPFAASAQTRPAPPDVPARVATLGLAATPDQQARIDAVAARYAGQTDAAALWAAAAEIGAVLTPEQVAGLAPARGARRDGARPEGARGGRRGDARRPDGARPDGARGERLGGRREARPGTAADPSRAAMRAVRDEFAPRAEALRASRRAGQITQAQFAEQSRALRAEVEARLDATRTPEQRQRAAAGRARRDAAEAARVRALGLTPQQQDALRALRDARPERGAAQPGTSERDPQERDPQARRAQADARREQAAAIMTPQQRATMAVHAALTHSRHGRPGPAPAE